MPQSISIFFLSLPSSFPPSHHVSGYLTSLLLVLFYCLPYVMYSLGAWDLFIIEQYKKIIALIHVYVFLSGKLHSFELLKIRVY